MRGITAKSRTPIRAYSSKNSIVSGWSPTVKKKASNLGGPNFPRALSSGIFRPKTLETSWRLLQKGKVNQTNIVWNALAFLTRKNSWNI